MKYLSFLMLCLIGTIGCSSVQEKEETVSDASSEVVISDAKEFVSTLTGNEFEKQIQVNAYVSEIQRTRSLTALDLKKLYLTLAFALCPSVPEPVNGSWGMDDQAGNTNTQGAGTACRAGVLQSFMTNGKTYKLSHVFDENSPHSVFASSPLTVTPNPTFCLEPPIWPYAANFCGHSESLSGEFGSEGTQMDFFGHAGLRANPTDPISSTVFYNGFTADEVFDGALSADAIKPINTIGILLDAKKHNGGVSLGPDDVVTVQDVQDMLVEQDLNWLGIKPGMVVFIYTGKGDTWGVDPYYYLAGPGLSVDVVENLYKPNHVVMHGLDNPFSDQANLLVNPPTLLSGNDPLDPFPVHTRTLTAGIIQGQNFNFTKMAQDKVYLFAIQLSPPQIAKAKGSMVTPQAFGAPWK